MRAERCVGASGVWEDADRAQALQQLCGLEQYPCPRSARQVAPILIVFLFLAIFRVRGVRLMPRRVKLLPRGVRRSWLACPAENPPDT